MKSSAFLVLITASGAVAAGNLNGLFRSCVTLLDNLTFECPQNPPPNGIKVPRTRIPQCSCQSIEYIASYADCALRTEHADPKPALFGLAVMCGLPGLNAGLSVEKIMNIHKNATDYFIDYDSVSIPRGGTPATKDPTKKTVLYNPVRVSQEKLEKSFISHSRFYGNMYEGQFYGGIINAYFGFFVFAAMVMNFCKKFFPKQFQFASNISVIKKFRQKIANPATFNRKHGVPAKWMHFINMSVPTRAQTLVLSGYWIMFIIFNLVNYNYFDDSTVSLDSMIAARTGLLACTHLPLLFLFAGRNNILLYLTNWSYDTMSCYHRWLARGMYTMAFVHSVAFTTSYKKVGRYYSFSRSTIVWGIVATVLGAFILFFSLRHFREHAYEFFLLFHKAFVVFFLIGMFYHVTPVAFSEWIWVTIGIWAFDRAARVIRIIISGLNAKAECRYYPESDVIKAKINYSKIWGASPGAYVFVYFLKPFWKCWQNHPFSVYQSPVAGEENKLVLCIRGRGGWTRSMSNYFSRKHNYSAVIPILLEGPYGQHFPLENNDTVLLIAGGIGVTAVYSYLDKLRAQGKRKEIIFVWLSQSDDNIHFFKDELESLIQQDNIQVYVYISQMSGLSSSSSGSLTEMKDFSTSSTTLGISASSTTLGLTSIEESKEETRVDLSKIMPHLSYGRPNLGQIIHNTVSAASGSTGVMVCGPPGMNDDVRRFVTKEMGISSNHIDLYVEGFNW